MKMNAIIVLAFVLICASLQASAANASMRVPAVVTDGGGVLILITVDVRNGTGNIYTSTNPLIGIDTQQSERKAVENAMAVLGKNESDYDVFLTMDVGETRQVDGPSAGAAMTLLTISALEGRPLRGDFTVTGTIEDGGKVGAVGGIYQKVEAASAGGIKLVLLPRESDTFDKITLVSLMGRLNVTVFEVDNITQVRDIAFAAEGTYPQPLPVETPAPLHLQPYSYDCPGCGVGRFGEIASGVVESSANETEDAARSNSIAAATVLPLLREDVADSGEMLANGYFYTAANTAFLNRINAEVVKNGSPNRQDLALLISDVGSCINGIDRGRLTKENLGFRVGADLRATWARNKLAEVKKQELAVNDSEEVLVLYKDALLAKSWCGISKELYSAAAEVGGSGADEAALRNLALARVGEARGAMAGPQGEDSDLQFHFSSAEMALNASEYGAAVYDADYVLGALRAANYSAQGENAASQKASGFLARKGKTLWSALFFAHASFYNLTGGDAGTVLRLGSIADGMENDTTMMLVLFENPNAVPAPSATPASIPAQENVEKLNESLVVVIVLLSILLVTSAILSIVLYTRAISKGRAMAAQKIRVAAKRRRK